MLHFLKQNIEYVEFIAVGNFISLIICLSIAPCLHTYMYSYIIIFVYMFVYLVHIVTSFISLEEIVISSYKKAVSTTIRTNTSSVSIYGLCVCMYLCAYV